MSTVILGGGIIGLSTAYYLSLSQPAAKIHIIDSSPTLFTSASGYAGGFVALDWFSHSVASLGALSFRLHRELAENHGGQRRWGYAGSQAYSLSVDERGVRKKGKKRKKGKEEGGGEDWLSQGTSRAALAMGAERCEMVNHDGSPTVWDAPGRRNA